MDNDVLTRNENGELSVRTVNATEQANVVNPDDIYTRTMEGYLAVRTVGGSGGGGSDAHNLGYYETLAALQAAHPTAEAGDWAIVAESDTVYIWDATQQAWVDTDRKGQVESVNGKTGAVVLSASDVEAIPQYTSMPLASSNNANFIVQYKGATNSTYTNGYFYKNVANVIYTGTVSFEAASLSGTTVACSGDNFANFLTESGVSPLSVVSGTMTYDAAGNLWILVGKNADDETVLTFQEYQEDYEDAGFTFTGTPQDGDIIAFTCTVQEASASYAWTRIDVQPAPVIPDPLPDQTGQSGKFLSTDGSSASWSDKPLVNGATGVLALSIGTSGNLVNGAYITCVGSAVRCTGFKAVAFGYSSQANSSLSVAIGAGAKVLSSANNAIQIGDGTNSDSNTFKVANANGNFEMMSADGTIPKERLVNVVTTPSTMPELTVAGWSNNTQTVTVTGVTATNTVFVSPAPASASDYSSAGIICTAQGTDSLTFTCTTVPANAITVNVVIF